ncbi:MAG: hypothetical protein AB7M12_07245 [Hyphomonadaceae bacterium]
MISAIFYAQYRISKKVFAETRQALDERRRAAVAAGMAEAKAPAGP